MAIGTGVFVGGADVTVGGRWVGETETVGKFGVPPEQATSKSKIRDTKIRFRVDILPIIPEVLPDLRAHPGPAPLAGFAAKTRPHA
jgi:hypothetical protein